MEPFEVFPELVWEKIFDKIDDDKDKLSFLRAHSDFRKLFKKKYVELGFVMALPVLMDYFEGVAPDWSWGLNRERRETILSCRLVSRKCSKAVDNWMESYWENEEDIDPPRILCDENKSNHTELWTVPQVEKFTKHFGTLPDDRMPVLSRSLSTSVPLYEEGRWDAYIVNAEQEFENNERRNVILTAIGEHVRALTLDVTLSNIPGVDNVANKRARIKSYKSVLELVPNIISVKTLWEPILYPGWEEEEGMLDFPEFPQLIHLNLAPSRLPENEVFATYMVPFERYFPQLIHLQLFTLYGWKDEYMEAGRFPKLRHLRLLNIHPGRYNHKRKLLKMCEKLFAPSLETLSVRIHGYTEEEMYTKAPHWIRKVINSLNKLFKEENAHWHACLEDWNQLHFWRVPN